MFKSIINMVFVAYLSCNGEYFLFKKKLKLKKRKVFFFLLVSPNKIWGRLWALVGVLRAPIGAWCPLSLTPGVRVCTQNVARLFISHGPMLSKSCNAIREINVMFHCSIQKTVSLGRTWLAPWGCYHPKSGFK